MGGTLLNMTTIYATIMLPITLGYMEREKREGEQVKYSPLIFLILLLMLAYIKGDFRWGVMWFNIRRIFM